MFEEHRRPQVVRKLEYYGQQLTAPGTVLGNAMDAEVAKFGAVPVHKIAAVVRCGRHCKVFREKTASRLESTRPREVAGRLRPALMFCNLVNHAITCGLYCLICHGLTISYQTGLLQQL